MKLHFRQFAYLLILASLGSSTSAGAGDWPMWRHDPGRTATTSSFLDEKLEVIWKRELPKPVPAYQDTRLQFDASYEPIVLGKRLFVGSNQDDSVAAFDTDSGELLWRFHTNGPVRFAPVGGDGRIIFGSDDGCVYCVKASDGSLVWKKRAVPSERLVLGNGRLISVWPIRGGPVLHDDRVYFAAGVWPLEGTFVFCVDASSGETIWRNDEAAYRYQVHPHNAEAYGGLAPQGYLLIEGDDVVVPSSQAYPARFDRVSGELKEFELPAPGRIPGGWFASTPSAKEELKLKRRGLLFDAEVNTKPHEDKPRSEGLPEIRSTMRTKNRELHFADALPGVSAEVTTILTADEKFFAVTREGTLFCFGKNPDKQAIRVHPSSKKNEWIPSGNGHLKDLPQQGQAVLLGINNAYSIDHLLATTELQVIAIDSNPDRIESLREHGSHGIRLHLIEADPATIKLPPYLANLILIDPDLEMTVEQLQGRYHALRPYGGIMIGHAENLPSLARESALSRAKIEVSNGRGRIIREGSLEGASNYAGDWASSEDQLVKAPLGLLWFGDSATHFKRSPQPKFIDGVMISNPKDWTDASTRKGKVDYRLLETTFTDVYTGRILTGKEAPAQRQSFTEIDRETIQPSQYRPPTQEDDWKPGAPRAGERSNPLTGETEPRTFPKSYGCDGGVDYGMLYSMRSGTPAFYDKRTESGTINISGPRSGCTNSVIPANGVLNLPYFYEGCTCSYPLPLSLALVSMPETFEQWASWGAVEPNSLDGKIQRLGLNFGAPGDRVTHDGTLWLDLPSVGGPSPEVSVTTEPSLENLETFYQHSLFLEEGGRGWPWVAGSGIRGVIKVTVDGLVPGTYRLRVTYLVNNGNTLSIGGKPITSKDPSSGTDTIEIDPITVSGNGRLTLELTAEGKDPTQLNGIEIIRADLPSSPIPQW